MKIGILGDVHGSLAWVAASLEAFQTEGITHILQLGDFGIWPGQSGAAYLKMVNSKLKAYGQTMFVTPGNHDDYDQINAVPVSEDGWQHLRSNILLAPRGHRWEWDGVSFVSLGGAPSVDRSARLYSRSKVWWAEEFITPEDLQRVVDGGYADVMVAHDAPFVPGIEKEISSNPFGFLKTDLDYAYEGRMVMQQAFEAVQPRIFMGGHYHFKIDEFVGISRVMVFSCNHRPYSLGMMDTEDLSVEHWHSPETKQEA